MAQDCRLGGSAYSGSRGEELKMFILRELFGC